MKACSDKLHFQHIMTSDHGYFVVTQYEQGNTQPDWISV